MTQSPEQRRAVLAQHHFEKEKLRHYANTAYFFMLCQQGHGGCRRAERCRGLPHECVDRFSGLMPEEAYEWLEAAFDAHRHKVPHAQLAEEHPDEFEAITAWRKAVDAAFGPMRAPMARCAPVAPRADSAAHEAG